MKKITVTALVVFTLLLNTSCTKTISESPAETEKEKETTILYLFEDVPVPQGFKIDREKSFVYRSGNKKSGILYLVGGIPPSSVKKFYMDNLPAYGWKLLNLFDWKGIFMNFIKKGWLLNIEITPKWDSSSQVKILIGPTEEGVNTR